VEPKSSEGATESVASESGCVKNAINNISSCNNNVVQ
jgi:hypothetical protein